jgi:hypothetical protein
METGYSFKIGYLSGHTADMNQDEAWGLLKACCTDIATSPHHLHTECERDIPVEPEFIDEKYIDYAKIYSAESGNPLTCDEERQMFFISASGGNPSRAIKEHMAMAFIRLVLDRMNKRGIPICVTVS